MSYFVVQRIEIPAPGSVLPECDEGATPAKFYIKDTTTGQVTTDVVCLTPTPAGVHNALQILADAGYTPNDFQLGEG